MKKILLLGIMAICAIAMSAQLPNVKLQDINGKTVQTGEISNNGNPVIISFWATWCKPCLRELKAIHEVYPDWQEETGVKMYIVSVDQAQDAQQLTTIITLPIIVAFVVTMMIMKDPNSPVVFWCSMIPFTSPIVMVARIPSGIPAWEIATSLVLLYATFVVCVWGAAKIYKIGIFMHGSKPSLRDLWRWLKY